MKHRLKRKSENWRRKLPRPIVLRKGKPLLLLSDCRDYALALDEEQHHDKWQRAMAPAGTLRPWWTSSSAS
jgi:hypothetical protein